MQKLYSDKRKEKMELLKGLTLGRDDTPNLSPLPNKVLFTYYYYHFIEKSFMYINLLQYFGL